MDSLAFFLLLVPFALALNHYCPSTNDLQVAYSGGTISIVNQGWTITSGGGVASKASYNLLGGWISYTANFNSDPIGVNGNIYSISPTFSGGSSSSFNKGSDYCDGQGSGSTWCVEVDWIESNGFCGGATTLHTVQGSGSGCNSGGCQSSYAYGSNGNPATSSGSAQFTMNVSFSTSGVVTVIRAGSQISAFSPTPGSSDYSTLASYYSSRGAVIYSTLWTGWVPESSCGTSGNLNGASFSISNLQLYGTIVQGPAATLCSGSAPAPTPTTKAPTPSPSSTCNFQYSLSGRQCQGLTQKTGVTSQSACQSACCSTTGCQVYQWWTSNSQCWLGKSGYTVTTSHCPTASGSFVSYSTVPLSSSENVSNSAVQQNLVYIILFPILAFVLLLAVIFTLRVKSRSRGQTMRDYVRDSISKPPQSQQHVPLEAAITTQASTSTVQDTPSENPAAPITQQSEWEKRVDETSGQTYYYNRDSGVTQYEIPDGFTA